MKTKAERKQKRKHRLDVISMILLLLIMSVIIYAGVTWVIRPCNKTNAQTADSIVMLSQEDEIIINDHRYNITLDTANNRIVAYINDSCDCQ